ncbi:lytic transglycosylase domain-containing protein [Goodfellowiella coeruleoviolacea]|uniref:Transglycosylase SLT domain-containing protein n=1 Tax=Goodfellowiella coeruleoviolacea TaxID=334858 RepID=A0AAE3GIF0_9PSEU|nr:lytic murein transglycosylase [Goodfellowiella coeruleoviolacea]MCP2168782.1 Transglycosylase SLT domain-containing protein [Goodfellowiella coeruleoviolacea]
MAVPRGRSGKHRKSTRSGQSSQSPGAQTQPPGATARRRGLSPRQWGLAATAATALLAPPAMFGTGVMDWVNLADSTALNAYPPGPGDILGLLRTKSAQDPELAANGSLPEVGQLSQELLDLAQNPPALAAGAADLPAGPLGIPGVVLDAYRRAEQRMAVDVPTCHLRWSLLAGIGRIESGHARGGRVDANGTTVQAILGPQLSGGPKFAAIRDTDGGRYDRDTAWDRAVGPMQFIPSTWARYASDGNGDGVQNPHNIYDASLAAGYYLCAGGGDLSDPAQRARAVFRYNHSDSYVRTVLVWADAYAAGVTPLPGDYGQAPGDLTNPGLPVSNGDPVAPAQPGTEVPAGTTQPTTTSQPGQTTSAPPSSTSSTSSTPSTTGSTPSTTTTPSTITTTITLPPSSSSSSSPSTSTSPSCPDPTDSSAPSTTPTGETTPSLPAPDDPCAPETSVSGSAVPSSSTQLPRTSSPVAS